MNQLGLFHLALSKNAGYPILWQVWCGNYDQSLGCGLPFFLTNLGRHPLGHPQSSIARETMYSCPQTRHTSTPHSGMQSLKNSPTKMKCWGIIKSLKIDLWMLDHLMFGLPSLFFCRIRLVELVKSKANFRPRLWTLNSTSAKPYDFTLNILTFRTSQAVSADAIGAPVQDIQIWSNQICTNIKCSLSSSHQSRAITGHAETDMDQPQAMLEAKTPVHRNKPFVAPVTSTRHIGALTKSVRCLTLLAHHMSAWHQNHHRTILQANWTAAAGALRVLSASFPLWRLCFPHCFDLKFVTGEKLSTLQGIKAHYIQLLYHRRKLLVKTCWFTKAKFTWTQPLRCVDLTFRLELLNRFLNKFLLSRLRDPSQMLRKVHGQTKWAKWLRVASLLAKISRLGPKVALISSQLVGVGSLFEDVSYTEMMRSHEFSPPCMTTKWSWVAAGPAATEGWSIVSALRCYEDIPRCLCADH